MCAISLLVCYLPLQDTPTAAPPAPPTPSAPPSPSPSVTQSVGGAGSRLFASPYARTLAADKGVDLQQVSLTVLNLAFMM